MSSGANFESGLRLLTTALNIKVTTDCRNGSIKDGTEMMGVTNLRPVNEPSLWGEGWHSVFGYHNGLQDDQMEVARKVISLMKDVIVKILAEG